MYNKVFINGDFCFYSKNGGVARVAKEILQQFDELIDDNVEYFLLIHPKSVYKPVYQNIKVIEIGKNDEKIFHWKYKTIQKYVKKEKGVLLDITQLMPTKCDSIIFVDDCMPESFPKDYNSLIKRFVRRPLRLLQRKKSIHRAKKLITISEYSREQIVKIFKIERKSISIVPCAWDHFNNVKPDYSIANLVNKEFIFMLGSNVWHKNIDWIIRAALDNDNYTFVVSGDNKYAKNEEKCSNVMYTGYISDSQIKGLMEKCKAFVLPSYCEGFGIPPMEALSVGAKLILSNTSCLPEIYGNTAYYIDPYQKQNINIDEIMSGFISEPHDLLKKYTWNKSAIILKRIIDECIR